MKLKVILFVTIVLLAAFFRLYGINWDQNQHLHPDERFLTMVSTSIQWPQTLMEYFNTNTSPLNPHNKDFPFFVYGTFPIFFTKYIAEILKLGDYQNLTLVGRQLSAYLDIGTVIIVFCIAKQIRGITKINKESEIDMFPFLAMFFYSVMVLPIQLSHFFAVDTYLTFFLTCTFYLLTKAFNTKSPHALNIFFAAFSGISFSLAISSKISALLFLPIIALFVIIILIKTKSLLRVGLFISFFLVFAYITLRFTQPYLFQSLNFLNLTLNPKMIQNWKTLETFNDPSGWYPPAVQWITTKAYIFPLKNLILWGVGLPTGILAITSIAYLLISIGIHVYKRKIRVAFTTEQILLSLCLLWILMLFAYQGMQFVKALRYFYPIYPFLAFLSAWFIVSIFNKFKIGLLGYCVTGLLILVYPLSFLAIYSNPHTRVQASFWIYQNIPPSSVIANEYWDDPLPLNLPNQNPSQYESVMLPLYDADTQEKWGKLSEELEQVDYIILSSNRLYGSILTVPEKYPLTKKYYESLFDGSLGFEKIVEFTSRPHISLPFLHICLTPPGARYGIIARKSQKCMEKGISFVDDYADETFTVYDHPKVIIFKKITAF